MTRLWVEPDANGDLTVWSGPEHHPNPEVRLCELSPPIRALVLDGVSRQTLNSGIRFDRNGMVVGSEGA